MPKGVTYYTETWDTGLGGWTVNTPVGSVDWMITNTGPGTTTSTYPVPPLNTSTPDNWAIVDDDFLGVNGLATETWLVSPVIDLSGAPANLKLEFEQYFQEWQADHCFVGVSTDGGLSWNETEVNEGVGRDGRPNPELLDVDISAWVAGDPANVQLRFKYVSVWDYGWQVDNVTIKDLPQNDMALLRHNQTDFNFTATGLANIEYTVYPESQVREMVLNGFVKNKGFLGQTNVALNTAVTGPGGPEFSDASAGTAFAPTDTASIFISGFTPSGDLGTYSLSYGVTQAEVDDLPSNNTANSTFAVDACVWAQDDGAATNSQQQGPDNVGDQYELGNYFDVVNNAIVFGVAIGLDDDTDVGALIYGVIYDIDFNVIEVTDDYEVQAADLNGPGGSSYVLLPFASAVSIAAGDAYCIMGGSYGGGEQVVFSTSGISAAQVSIIRYPNTPQNFFLTKTPMTRALLTGDCIGLGISDAPSLTGGITAWPNPFTTTANLSFELEKGATVHFQLRDLTGRLVMDEALGTLGSGNHQYGIDGAGLASGTYAWDLLIDGHRRSGLIAHSTQ